MLMKTSRYLGLWRTLSRAAIAAVVGVAILAASAHAVSLSALINSNGSIVFDDKKFSNFRLVAFGSGDYYFDPAAIEVNGYMFGPDPGLEFTGLMFANTGAVLNVNIKFDVEVLDPLKRIVDIGLTFNGSYIDGGQTQIVDSAFVGIQNVGQGFVYATPVGTKLTDHLLLQDPVNGYEKIRVVKDISLLGGPKGTAKISYIGQSFSQVIIPEPATMTVLAAGLGSLLIRRRRSS